MQEYISENLLKIFNFVLISPKFSQPHPTQKIWVALVIGVGPHPHKV